MKCIIPGANVKVFGRAIHSLSKLGEELYVELLQNGLALRTVNSARSAYACFMFAPTFFITYDVQLDSAADQQDALKCKINMKSCVTVFKSLTVLEKTVDKCKISIHPDDARLIFQLFCHHGIVKTHKLLFIECDSLQAVFAKELSPNVLTAQTRLFADAVMNFQMGQEEISLIATPLGLTVKSYVEDEPDPSKAIRTELRLMPDEFDCYTIGIDSEVTFCLKELRAVLSFSESPNLPLSFHFDTPGKPIILAIDGDATFEAIFVLATLAVDALPTSQSTSSQQVTPATGRVHQPPQQISAAVDRGKKTRLVQGDKNAASKLRTAENSRSRTDHETNDVEMDSFNINNETTMADQSMQDTSLPAAGVHSITESSSRVHELNRINAPAVRTATEAAVNQPVAAASRLFGVESATDEGRSVIPQTTKDVCLAGDSDDDDNDVDNLVPGTPPNKKFKSLFFGLSQSTTSGSQTVAPPPVVLAEDSEED